LDFIYVLYLGYCVVKLVRKIIYFVWALLMQLIEYYKTYQEILKFLFCETLTAAKQIPIQI